MVKSKSNRYIVHPNEIDLKNVLVDIPEIRNHIPQRFEMEMLSAIVFADSESMRCAGRRNVTGDDFWVRGHMPGMPLMPGVLMCEAAGQLASYFTQKYDLLGGDFVVLGGIDKVRFRGTVVPGDCLVLACELIKIRRGRMVTCRFQGIVGERIVMEGELKGVPFANP